MLALVALALALALGQTLVAALPGRSHPLPQPPDFLPCWANASLAALPFCNPSLSAPARAKDLASRLTLAEKFTQFGVLNQSARTVGAAVPRLGVATYTYHSEGLHGIRTACIDVPGVATTLFPQVTGMAATGNLSLMGAMGSMMGDEARALNNIANGTTFEKGAGLDYWGPTMNIGRDPRWGRFQESVSECPWLNGAYAYNFVRGMQGSGDSDSSHVKVAVSILVMFSGF